MVQLSVQKGVPLGLGEATEVPLESDIAKTNLHFLLTIRNMTVSFPLE